MRRWLLRAGYPVLRAYWFVRRPHRIGVKCVITRGSDVLLVRHTYRERNRWDLPGGAPRRGEAPHEAARREAREELGADLTGWTTVGSLRIEAKSGGGTLHCVHVTVAALPLDATRGEIADVAWFPRGGLPPNTSLHVDRLIDLAPGAAAH